MEIRTFNIIIDIRTEDVDGNKIKVNKTVKKIEKKLKNEWNICSYDIEERIKK